MAAAMLLGKLGDRLASSLISQIWPKVNEWVKKEVGDGPNGTRTDILKALASLIEEEKKQNVRPLQVSVHSLPVPQGLTGVLQLLDQLRSSVSQLFSMTCNQVGSPQTQQHIHNVGLTVKSLLSQLESNLERGGRVVAETERTLCELRTGLRMISVLMRTLTVCSFVLSLLYLHGRISWLDLHTSWSRLLRSFVLYLAILLIFASPLWIFDVRVGHYFSQCVNFILPII